MQIGNGSEGSPSNQPIRPNRGFFYNVRSKVGKFLKKMGLTSNQQRQNESFNVTISTPHEPTPPITAHHIAPQETEPKEETPPNTNHQSDDQETRSKTTTVATHTLGTAPTTPEDTAAATNSSTAPTTPKETAATNSVSTSSSQSSVEERQEIDQSIMRIANITEEELNGIKAFAEQNNQTHEVTGHVYREQIGTARSLIVHPGGVCPPGTYILCKGKTVPKGSKRAELDIEGGKNRATLAVNLETGKKYVFRSGFMIQRYAQNEINTIQAVNAIQSENVLGGDVHLYQSKPVKQTSERVINMMEALDLNEGDKAKKLGILSEYCEGGAVVDVSGNLTTKEIYQMLSDIAKGIKELHDHNMVNRDMKIDNILIKLVNGKKIFTISDHDTACPLNQYSFDISVGTKGCVPPPFKELVKNTDSTREDQGRAFDFWTYGMMIVDLFFIGSDNPNNIDSIYKLNKQYDIGLRKGTIIDNPQNFQKYQRALTVLIAQAKTRNPLLGTIIEHLLNVDPNKRLEQINDMHPLVAIQMLMQNEANNVLMQDEANKA